MRDPNHRLSPFFRRPTKVLSLRIILVDKVVQYRSGFPDDQIVVLVIDKRGDTSVWADFHEGRAFYAFLGVVAKVESYDVVRQSEMFEQDGVLEGVRTCGFREAERG
jgi:hypothetical protein